MKIKTTLEEPKKAKSKPLCPYCNSKRVYGSNRPYVNGETRWTCQFCLKGFKESNIVEIKRILKEGRSPNNVYQIISPVRNRKRVIEPKHKKGYIDYSEVKPKRQKISSFKRANNEHLIELSRIHPIEMDNCPGCGIPKPIGAELCNECIVKNNKEERE